MVHFVAVCARARGEGGLKRLVTLHNHQIFLSIKYLGNKMLQIFPQVHNQSNIFDFFSCIILFVFVVSYAIYIILEQRYL